MGEPRKFLCVSFLILSYPLSFIFSGLHASILTFMNIMNKNFDTVKLYNQKALIVCSLRWTSSRFYLPSKEKTHPTPSHVQWKHDIEWEFLGSGTFKFVKSPTHFIFQCLQNHLNLNMRLATLDCQQRR